MADYINPQTGEILISAHEAPSIDWVKNPDGIRAARSIVSHYRVCEDGRVREATLSEKAAIDLARLPQIKAAKKAALAREARQKFQLSDPDYVAAAALVDAAKTVAEVEGVSLAVVSKE